MPIGVRGSVYVNDRAVDSADVFLSQRNTEANYREPG